MRNRIVITFAWIALLFVPSFCIGQQGSASWNGVRFGQSPILRYAAIDDIIVTNYLRDSTYVYFTNETDSTWTLSEKYHFQYDIQGRQIESMHITKTDDKWQSTDRLRNYYSDSQLLSAQEEDHRDSLDGEWSHVQRRLFNYTPIGLQELIVLLNWEEQNWALYSKIEFEYNNMNYLTSQILYLRDEDADAWVQSERYVYTYSSKNNIKQKLFQIWNDSLHQWINDSSQEFMYNSDNHLISTTKRDWSPEQKSWVDLSVISIIYNEKGQILSSSQNQFFPNSNETLPSQEQQTDYDTNGNIGTTINSFWDLIDEEWQPYQKQEHFWSKHLNGNLDEVYDEIDCIFSNPYVIGLPWYCESLKPDVKYTVQVFDQLGRLYYTDYFMGNSSFRISQPLPPGFYVVVIRGGLDYHSEKILIQN